MSTYREQPDLLDYTSKPNEIIHRKRDNVFY